MSKYTLNGILEQLRQELILTEVKAREIGSRIEVLSRETESMKVDTLQNYLEEQRKSAALDRGIESLIRDRKMVRDTLLVAAVGLILGGLLTRDKLEAINAGMSGFDSMAQGYGESKWCVLLGKKISVVPKEMISKQVPWITLASFYNAMEELKKRALAGEKLENLGDIINKFEKDRG